MSRPDLDSLLNALLPFAKRMLAKHGEFFPFGAALSREGEVRLVQPWVGSEHPPSADVLDVLRAGLRDRALNSKIRAAGICVDARVQPEGSAEKTDAIQVILEHSDGEAIDVFLPYRRGLLGKLHFGDIFATRGAATVFSNPS
jgi:hypothetical protein